MPFSKALFFFLLSFILGVFLSSFFSFPTLIIIELFLLGIFYSIVFLKNRSIVIFAVCLIFLALGIWRTEIAKPYSFQYPEKEEFSFKIKLREIIFKNFSPPHSGILTALLLGDKSYISQEWKEKLNVAGVRHITAVSGMHIVIISGILLCLAIGLGLSRGQAFYFTLFFIWLFIAMINFPPSAVRAGIMSSVFLICQKLGRQNASKRVLFLTAAVMLALEPLLLRYNLGFQLSFLATMGIIYLMPFLQRIFERVKLLKFLDLSGILAMTFSAQLFVLPLLIYNFGYFSLVSPLSNILIVPILPFLMLFGFLFLLVSLIWQPLGFLVFLFVWLFLNYLVLLVDWLSRLPLASFYLEMSWLLIPLYYSLLSYFLWKLSGKRRRLMNLN